MFTKIVILLCTKSLIIDPNIHVHDDLDRKIALAISSQNLSIVRSSYSEVDLFNCNPKFGDSCVPNFLITTSSSHSNNFHTNVVCITVFPLLIYACVFGEFVLKLMYEDFKTTYMRILIFIFVSSQSSVLDAFCDLIIILSIGLHAIKFNPMCHTLP
jgi:ABC-type multidrug transport system permease subunit